ncbi:MAG: hypothetical protein ACQEXX_13895 [Bacillota bacterium]
MKRVTLRQSQPLNVLQGSSAKQLYIKFGFNVDREDAIDVYKSLVVEGD